MVNASITRIKVHVRKTLGVALLGLVLAACGGGGGGGGSDGGGGSNTDSDRFSIGGTVTGLSGSLVLINRSGTFTDQVTVSSNGSFRFSSYFAEGRSYSISIATQPENQECTIDNGSGTINGSNITSVSIHCTDLVSLSGTISAAINISYDSDVNDPNAPYADNNSVASAQIINNNYFTLHGFASAAGVANYELTGRFANSADTDDFFRVSLQQGQSVQLQIVDHDSFNATDAYAGDLDLALLRFDSGINDYVVEAVSNGTTELEEVTPAVSGEYLILVYAYGDTGASKYILRLAPEGLGSTQQGSTQQGSTQQGLTPRSPSVNFVPGEMIVKFKNPGLSISALATEPTVQAMQLTFNHHDMRRPVHAKIARPLQAKTNNANKIKTEHAFREKLDTLQAIKRMSQQKEVAFAEPNYRLQPLRTPNDEFYEYQWHYPLINLPQAWNISTGATAGQPVIVAVIDTGVYLNHPDLQNQLVAGYDFISDSSRSRDGDGIDSNPDDPGDDPALGKSSWHGTHVAGTVAAETDSSDGAAGTSWNAKIMPVRVLGSDGGTVNDVLDGIRFAAGLSNTSNTLPAQRADIINLSLGGNGYSQALQETISQARAAGVIVIAAAGNENTSARSYPAAYEGVVSVSAVTYEKLKASYSNYGATIDVAAPGGDITQDRNGDGFGDGVLSTSADDTSGVRVPAWAFYQGTSMATPHVAGIAALMKAVHPDLTPADFDTLLQSGTITEDLGASGRDDIFGHGLIDANLAVLEAYRLANGGALPVIPAQLVATPSNLAMATTSQSTLNLSNTGGTPDPSNVTVSESASWLSVTPIAVDGNGLGDYRIDIDRTGLNDGSYQTTLDIAFDRSGTPDAIRVNVTMQVGVVSTEGELITQYVLLVDADEQEVTHTVIAESSGGELVYAIDRIQPGNYYILSGSDVDNDDVVCQSGESCGAYPSLAERQIISLDTQSISGLDILVDIPGGINSSGVTASDNGSATSRLATDLPAKAFRKIAPVANHSEPATTKTGATTP